MEVVCTEKVFVHPTTILCAGITNSGKTTLVSKIILNLKSLMSPCPEKIIFFFCEPQEVYRDLKQKSELPIEFIRGCDFNFRDYRNALIIVDDFSTELFNQKSAQEMFFRASHHQKLSFLTICQNIFTKTKYGRDIRLNTHYFILLKSITLNAQVKVLSQQLFPDTPRFLSDSYKKATAEPYSYLIVVLHPKCTDLLRVRSGIFPGEKSIVYIPK